MKRIQNLLVITLTMLLALSACTSGDVNSTPANTPLTNTPTPTINNQDDKPEVTPAVDWTEIPLDAWEYKYDAALQGIVITSYIEPPNILRVRIPDEIEGMPVVGLDFKSMANRGFMAVYIPETVTKISSYAFDNSNLTSITLPAGLTVLGDGAFHECVGLTTVVLPDGLTEIGANTFLGCINLSIVTIGDNVTRIERNAFSNTALWNNQAVGLIYVDSWVVGYKDENGNKGNTGYSIPAGTLTIQEGTKGIGTLALQIGAKVDIILPDSLTLLNDGAISLDAGGDDMTITYKGVTYETYEGYSRRGIPPEFFEQFAGNNYSKN